jgi:arylsulfatase A-like enzyme
MPTILDLAGLPVPEEVQGTSFIHMIPTPEARGRRVAVSGGAIDVASAQDAVLTVQDERWCLIDRPDASRRELYDKTSDRAQERNVISEHPQKAQRLHQQLLDFLVDHEAHPALVQWFQSGQKGDTSDYQHVPPYLARFRPYWEAALDAELHR